MNEESPVIEPEVAVAVEQLLGLLGKKEEIIRYQKADKQVRENKWVQEMIESIKEKQQELVSFEYYEKPQAYKVTLQKLEELNRQLEENISVRQYKASLIEADEMVQYLFSLLQESINAE